jgi:hypothetical protein
LVVAIELEGGQNSLVTIALWCGGSEPAVADLCSVERGRMSVILYLLGILVAAVGVAAIGFGIPINEFTLGTTLIVTGVTGLTGGLILIGLAAVVSELGRLRDALKTRPVARRAAEPVEAPAPAVPSMVAVPPPPAAAGPRPSPASAAPVGQRSRPDVPAREPRAPQPHPAAATTAVDVSASAIERLRSAIPRGERPKAEPSVVAEGEEVPLSPSEGVPHQPAAPLAPKITAEDRAGGAAVEALKASRLDFLFRSKPAARPASQPEGLDIASPAESRPPEPRVPDPRAPTTAEGEPQPAQAQPEPAAPEPQDQPSEPAVVEEPRTAAILKSGVVDGMAYTLYADGSIEAKLPHGTVRFGSIAELRAHIESNS